MAFVAAKPPTSRDEALLPVRDVATSKTRQQREFYFLESTQFIARKRLLETPFD